LLRQADGAGGVRACAAGADAMMHRFLPPNPTLADRFGNLLYWLFEGMALDWRRRGVTHVHAMAISLRVHGLWKRVHRVLEAYRVSNRSQI